MSGIDPYTGEDIIYPGERRSDWDRFMYGSHLHGGGLVSYIGPIFIVLGGTIFLLAISGAFGPL